VNSLTDQKLLGDYTERQCEAAFAELVRRHVDLVYSAALRMVRDAHLAEEQAAQVRKDQTLTPEARASARESIRQQTEKAIQTMLGEKGWDQFNRPTYNWWLDTINPRPVQ